MMNKEMINVDYLEKDIFVNIVKGLFLKNMRGEDPERQKRMLLLFILGMIAGIIIFELTRR